MKFKSFKIVKICFDDLNLIFSQTIFVLKLYFATIISVRSTEKGRIREDKKHWDHPDPDHWFLISFSPCFLMHVVLGASRFFLFIDKSKWFICSSQIAIVQKLIFLLTL